MQKYERDYALMVQDILRNGEQRQTRNAITTAKFGMSLEVPVTDWFPIIQGRKMYPDGVFGELAAMLRQPKCVEDFTKWGCNYWKDWADEDGTLNIDYGNAWFDFNGTDQIADLKDKLANNPTDRRMIISGWRPDRLAELSLPCCHYSYQFYVGDGKLDMIWTQRSVDMMVGLPSDIVFAAAWLIAIANEFNLAPGKVKFDLGDCHVYESHWEAAREYVRRVSVSQALPVSYDYHQPIGADFCEFEPTFIHLGNYAHLEPLKLELLK